MTSRRVLGVAASVAVLGMVLASSFAEREARGQVTSKTLAIRGKLPLAPIVTTLGAVRTLCYAPNGAFGCGVSLYSSLAAANGTAAGYVCVIKFATVQEASAFVAAAQDPKTQGVDCSDNSATNYSLILGTGATSVTGLVLDSHTLSASQGFQVSALP